MPTKAEASRIAGVETYYLSDRKIMLNLGLLIRG